MRLEVTPAVCHWWLAWQLLKRGKLSVDYRVVAVLARRVRVKFEQHQSVHMVEHVTRLLQPNRSIYMLPLRPYALCPPKTTYYFLENIL